MLFDAASRGRYATDASIYQVDAARRARAAHARRRRARPSTSAANSACRCSRAAPALAVRPDHRRGAGHRRQQAPARCWRSTREAMTAEVEPGIVLDALNARLKPHGLWFPVDVSTSAQATIGGMAGNNSCGSRSIAYGNMVHNVLGIDAWLSDGSERVVRPGRRDGRERRRASRATSCAAARDRRARARRDRGAVAEGDAPRRRLQPRHLPSAERAAVHRRRQRQLAHLLVGSEGTLAVYRELKLKLAPLPRAQGARRRQLPDASARDGGGAAPGELGPVRGRARRPDDDRARPRQPGVPADDRRGADRRAGRRSCWSSSAATTRERAAAPAERWSS